MHSVSLHFIMPEFSLQKDIVSVEIISAISLLIHLLFKSDGEHQEHRFWFWPAAGAEQQGYRDTDASTLDSGAVLPAPDVDDGHPEQHCLGTSAGSHASSASSTTADPRQASGVVQKIRFWGLNNKTSTSCHWFLCFGTRPRHQTRAPWLGPPRLKKAKSNFFTNCNILHTLKNEPMNIMLLHTSRRMDGP